MSLGQTVIIGRSEIALICRRRMQMMWMNCRWWRLMVTIHTPIDVGPRFVGVRGRAAQQLSHESDVGDGQAKGFDAGQSFLVGEGGHLAAQLVEGLV